MGKLIRTHDWCGTSLGAPQHWPGSLRVTLGILLSSPFPMVLYWGKELVCFYNDAFRPSLGREGKHPSILGKTYQEAWPENWEELEPLIGECLKGQTTLFQDRLLPIYRNGKMEDVYWTFSFSPVKDEEGHTRGVLVVCKETTSRVMKFHNMVEQSNAPVILFKGEDLVIEEANEAALKLWQVERDVIGRSYLEVLPEVREQGFVPLLLEVYRTGVPKQGFEQLSYHFNRDGSKQEYYFNFEFKPFRESDGHVTGVMVLATNVTQQVLAKQQLAAMEADMREAIEVARLGYWSLNPQTKIFTCSRETKEIFGLPGEDDIALAVVLETIHPADRQEAVGIIQTALTYSGDGRCEMAYRIIHPATKQVRYIRSVGRVYFNDQQLPYRFSGTVQDISQSKIAEQALFDSEERLRIATASANVGTWSYDLAENKIYASDQYKRLFGLSPEREMTYELFVSAIVEEDRANTDQLNRDVMAVKNGQSDYEWEYRVRGIEDGGLRWLKARGKVYTDVDGNPTRFAGAVIDITKEKRAEESLEALVQKRTEELRSSNQDLQQFAHVASHDLKEPVRKIRTFANRLQTDKASTLSENGKLFLNKIEKSAQRMYDMIDGVLTFSALTASQEPPQPVDLNEIVRQIEDDLEMVLREKGAAIRYNDLPVIKGAPVLIHQLFYNLLNNSLKFSRPGVPPLIHIVAEPTTEPSAFVQLTVKDNGIGFEPEHAESIFQTFTRLNSKDHFEGTGLGLSLCKKIIERHNGTIRALGVPNEGAEFIFRLPL